MAEPEPAAGGEALSEADTELVLAAAGRQRQKRQSGPVLYIAREFDVRPDPAPGELRGRWESITELADKLRQRAGAGWNTALSPATTLLVAAALDAYAPRPKALPTPLPRTKLDVDMFADGSTIYRLDFHGEALETVAWARSTVVAHFAFDALLEQYPEGRFLQKRRSWIERE